MAWGGSRRSADDEKVREALLRMASVDLGTRKGGAEKAYLAGLYAEQCRTNDLLEQLLTERSAAEQ